MKKKKNRYSQIIETLFFNRYKEGLTDIPFKRSEITTIAEALGIELPKNLGDIIYSF